MQERESINLRCRCPYRILDLGVPLAWLASRGARASAIFLLPSPLFAVASDPVSVGGGGGGAGGSGRVGVLDTLSTSFVVYTAAPVGRPGSSGSLGGTGAGPRRHHAVLVTKWS